jgi:hypothetical protein
MKFHSPATSGSLAVAIKPKAKENVHTSVIIYILKELQQKLHICRRSVTMGCITSEPWNECRLDATCSRFRRIDITNRWQLRRKVGVALSRLSFIPNFIKISHCIQKLNRGT